MGTVGKVEGVGSAPWDIIICRIIWMVFTGGLIYYAPLTWVLHFLYFPRWVSFLALKYVVSVFSGVSTSYREIRVCTHSSLFHNRSCWVFFKGQYDYPSVARAWGFLWLYENLPSIPDLGVTCLMLIICSSRPSMVGSKEYFLCSWWDWWIFCLRVWKSIFQ